MSPACLSLVGSNATGFAKIQDRFGEAVRSGVRQYIVLGAGLDTFAYRNQYPDSLLKIFEVDHPATQAWKRARLLEMDIPVPPSLAFAPVDFERESLAD